MDNYLTIAEDILRVARQPLSAREILRMGYAQSLFPSQLFGRTQHKTLQARISEDILLRRERSAFFRTEPGRFFLREFLDDQTIPVRFRQPILARRRRRDLPRYQALALKWVDLARLVAKRVAISTGSILSIIRSQQYHYARSTTDRDTTDVIVWSFVLVMRGNCVLTYRHGRYREERDSFLKRRSLGFFAPVVEDDLTLFDQADHGILSSGLRTICIDLDIPADVIWGSVAKSSAINSFVYADGIAGSHDLLALIKVECPEWYEPLTRRLAINDLHWHDLTKPLNHIEDFDPWSQLVLGHTQLMSHRAPSINEAVG